MCKGRKGCIFPERTILGTRGVTSDVEEALDAMARHRVRRLPVLDGGRLVGILSQADAARALSGTEVGRTVNAISRG